VGKIRISLEEKETEIFRIYQSRGMADDTRALSQGFTLIGGLEDLWS
jgi:hypothetical protein